MQYSSYKEIPKTIGILTYCRPKELTRMIKEVDKSLHYFGHELKDWSITVIDNSPPNYAEKNKEVLYASVSKLPIFYFGPEESCTLGKELDEHLKYDGIFGNLIRTDSSGARVKASLLGADKTLILLDDDMRLTELMVKDENGSDAEKYAIEAISKYGKESSVVSTGRFYKISETKKHTYERPFDLIDATTSMLGKRVSEVKIGPEYIGKAFGNRDKLIDELMLSDSDDEYQKIGFLAIDSDNVNPDAMIYWQGLNAVTGKTDCHATASIQGIGSCHAKSLTEDEYGNLFVNYAVHDAEEPKISVVSEWKESSMATFGILNTHPIPAYLLPRGEDVLFRQLLRPSSPAVLAPVGVYHDRSLAGRPDLATIYWNELMGAKICRIWKDALRYYMIGNGNGVYELGFITKPELEKDEKKSIARSVRRTYDILEETIKNGHRLAGYSKVLMDSLNKEFSGNFSSHAERGSESFRNNIFKRAEEYFDETSRRQEKLFHFWPEMVDYMRHTEPPVNLFNPDTQRAKICIG